MLLEKKERGKGWLLELEQGGINRDIRERAIWAKKVPRIAD